MQEERKNFVYGNPELNIPGCVNNGIDESIANAIYDQMVEFAKYAFNKSHAACYAAIALQTAYLKAHYPLEYACGLLTSVMDRPAKLAVYADEFRKKGVKIMAPDVNASGVSFEPYEDGVCYGLASIKDVGEKAVKAIIAERDGNGKFLSFQNFLKRADSNKRVVDALIKAGAFDFTGYSRRAMSENLERMLKELRALKKKNVKGQLSLFDDAPEDESENYYALESFEMRLEDCEEWPESELLKYEKEATGAYITGFPLDRYGSMLDRWSVEGLSMFVPDDETGEYDVGSGRKVKIAGIVSEVRVVYAKKSGKPMAFVTLADRAATVEVTVFPNAYETCGSLLVEDAPLVVYGSFSNDEHGAGVLADRVVSLANPPKDLWIRFQTYADFVNATGLLNTIKHEHAGRETSLWAQVVDANNYVTAEAFCLDGSREAYDLAVRIFGAQNVAEMPMAFFELPEREKARKRR